MLQESKCKVSYAIGFALTHCFAFPAHASVSSGPHPSDFAHVLSAYIFPTGRLSCAQPMELPVSRESQSSHTSLILKFLKF